MFSSKDLFFTPTSGAYTVSKSLRFRGGQYLNRTPGTAGDRKTWTWSGWVKRGLLTTTQAIFGAGAASANFEYIAFSGDNLYYYRQLSSVGDAELRTNAVFRDPSAWYHVVVAINAATTSAAIYVNGVLQTLSINDLPSNVNGPVNNTEIQVIGKRSWDNSQYFDGYLAEVNFIDGQALTPSSFGAYDTNGIWQPIAYTGSYSGTNSFYLKFTSVGSTTQGGANTGYGQDFAGTNNWTTNNFGTTSTATTYDSMLDSPTNAAGDIGNYCVLNPLQSGTTLASANLNFSSAGNSSTGTIAVTSGKWYWETTVAAVGNTSYIGVCDDTWFKTDGSWSYSQVFVYLSTGNKGGNGSSTSYGASYTTNNVIGVALDMDSGTITFYKDNASQGTAFSTGISGKTLRPFVGTASPTTSTYDINFGQRPFTYTPPNNFSALNTQNLTTPTIINGAQYMAAVTYQGATAPNTVTTTSSNSGNNPNGVSFQPDLVWIKSRSAATAHKWTDAVRGTTKALVSNSTAAETTDTNGLTAFTASGFTVGSDTTYNNTTGPATYVAWEWLAGTAPTTDNVAGAGNVPTAGSVKINGANSSATLAGSIAATRLSANTSAGFSVVTYTGTGVTASVGHGLGVAPTFVIFKQRNGANSWLVLDTIIGGSPGYMFLETTAARSTLASGWAPDSTKLNFAASSTVINTNTNTYVAYCFAPVAGYSAFGSYTGNGSADGPFIFTGFRPRWIMLKRTDAAASWYVIDTSRATYNVVNPYLLPNSSNAEATDLSWDILSNGFKLRSTYSEINASSATIIYAAFAENPFKISRAR